MESTYPHLSSSGVTDTRACPCQPFHLGVGGLVVKIHILIPVEQELFNKDFLPSTPYFIPVCGAISVIFTKIMSYMYIKSYQNIIHILTLIIH